MKLSPFHVEIADASDAGQQAALRTLRADALAEAGGNADAPDDTPDPAAWQVLARDDAGHVVGGAELRNGRTIVWLAVALPWRRRGAGSALVHALLARAQSRGIDAVTVSCPSAARGFFERAGFAPDGPVHREGDASPQTLRLTIAARPAVARPGKPLDRGALPAQNRALVAAARRQLLADARHRLDVYVPILDAGWFASSGELSELRRIACSGRSAGIRIVLHDPAAAITNDHPLLPLMQRLPTAFEVRTPVEEADLAYAGAYLLNDVGGYLHLPLAARAAGTAARNHRAAQLPLRQHHAAVWERSLPATVLNAVDL